MIVRRREFIALVSSAAVGWPLFCARAESSRELWVVTGEPPTFRSRPREQALRAGLHDLGYVEGKNFVFEFQTTKKGSTSSLNLPPNWSA